MAAFVRFVSSLPRPDHRQTEAVSASQRGKQEAALEKKMNKLHVLIHSYEACLEALAAARKENKPLDLSCSALRTYCQGKDTFQPRNGCVSRDVDYTTYLVMNDIFTRHGFSARPIVLSAPGTANAVREEQQISTMVSQGQAAVLDLANTERAMCCINPFSQALWARFRNEPDTFSRTPAPQLLLPGYPTPYRQPPQSARAEVQGQEAPFSVPSEVRALERKVCKTEAILNAFRTYANGLYCAYQTKRAFDLIGPMGHIGAEQIPKGMVRERVDMWTYQTVQLIIKQNDFLPFPITFAAPDTAEGADQRQKFDAMRTYGVMLANELERLEDELRRIGPQSFLFRMPRGCYWPIHALLFPPANDIGLLFEQGADAAPSASVVSSASLASTARLASVTSSRPGPIIPLPVALARGPVAGPVRPAARGAPPALTTTPSFE